MSNLSKISLTLFSLLFPLTANSSGFDMTIHGGQAGRPSSQKSDSGSVVWSSSEHHEAKERWHQEIEGVRQRALCQGCEIGAMVGSMDPEYIAASDREIQARVDRSPDIQNLTQAYDRLKSFKDRRDQAQEQIQGMDQIASRSQTVEEATKWAKASRQYYKEENFECGNITVTVAETLLDVAVSIVPITGWARDCYEAVLGRDLMSGEQLTTASQVMAMAGVLTGGVASKLGKATQVFQRLLRSERGIAITTKTTKLVESAKTLNIPVEKLKDYADSLRAFGGDIDKFKEAAAILTKKMDFLFGGATGSAHNISRSQDMLRQMERIGLPNCRASRAVVKDNLVKTLKDPSSVAKSLEGGKTLRESLLSGPGGHVKVESIWQGDKLVTAKIKGGSS